VLKGARLPGRFDRIACRNTDGCRRRAAAVKRWSATRRWWIVVALQTAVVVGALGAAALGAVLSARGQRPAEPRLLAPLPMGMATTRAHIIAPRAGEVAATGSAVHNDAA
jgi:hypothetical protein